jgi:hypothetical protein
LLHATVASAVLKRGFSICFAVKKLVKAAVEQGASSNTTLREPILRVSPELPSARFGDRWVVTGVDSHEQ